MTTPSSVPVPGEDGLPEFEAFAAPAGYDNEQSFAWAAGTEHMRTLALPLLASLRTERDALLRELANWKSGRLRKSWPAIESVPDGLHYAAELARTQDEAEDDAHRALHRHAAVRLRTMHDLAGPLLEERNRLRAEVERLETLVLEKHQAAEDWRNAAIAERDGALASRAVSPDADGLRLADDAVEKLAQHIADYWAGLRGGTTDETDAGLAHHLLSRGWSWAPSTTETAPGPADPTAPYRELLGCLWLYVDWRYVTKQLTTEQKELFADAVDSSLRPDLKPSADRWWRSPAASQDTAETADTNGEQA